MKPPGRASPPAKSIGGRSGPRDIVRRADIYREGLLSCILVSALAFVGQVIGPSDTKIAIDLVLGAVALTSIVSVVLLAMKVDNPDFGIILRIGALILIIRLRVSSKATMILRDNGIQVGFLGAVLSKN